MSNRTAGHQNELTANRSFASRNQNTQKENSMTNANFQTQTARTIRLFALALATLVIAATASAQTMFINYAPAPDNSRIETGLSGGARDASREIGYDMFGNRCSGFIFHTPDHVIRLGASQRTMTIEVESFEDTTLVIYHRESRTYICDDDSGWGLDAMATYYDWPAGTYEVFVGSYWRNDYIPYTLYVYR